MFVFFPLLFSSLKLYVNCFKNYISPLFNKTHDFRYDFRIAHKLLMLRLWVLIKYLILSMINGNSEDFLCKCHYLYMPPNGFSYLWIISRMCLWPLAAFFLSLCFSSPVGPDSGVFSMDISSLLLRNCCVLDGVFPGLFWSDKQCGVGGISEEQHPRARPRKRLQDVNQHGRDITECAKIDTFPFHLKVPSGGKLPDRFSKDMARCNNTAENGRIISQTG